MCFSATSMAAPSSPCRTRRRPHAAWQVLPPFSMMSLCWAAAGMLTGILWSLPAILTGPRLQVDSLPCNGLPQHQGHLHFVWTMAHLAEDAVRRQLDCECAW